jgi:Lrp/AsnC ligand binding domain
MRVWAYVFIATRQPKKVLRLVRQVEGVLHADAVFGSPDVIAVVAGPDIPTMDAVIDRIAAIRSIAGTDSKVARWIDGVDFPVRSAQERVLRARHERRSSARRARRSKGPQSNQVHLTRAAPPRNRGPRR